MMNNTPASPHVARAGSFSKTINVTNTGMNVNVNVSPAPPNAARSSIIIPANNTSPNLNHRPSTSSSNPTLANSTGQLPRIHKTDETPTSALTTSSSTRGSITGSISITSPSSGNWTTGNYMPNSPMSAGYNNMPQGPVYAFAPTNGSAAANPIHDGPYRRSVSEGVPSVAMNGSPSSHGSSSPSLNSQPVGHTRNRSSSNISPALIPHGGLDESPPGSWKLPNGMMANYSPNNSHSHSPTAINGNNMVSNTQTDSEWEDLDERVLQNPTFREIYHIVRMCSAQPSCDRMVAVLERQAKHLINASHVRLFLVQRDGLMHHSRQAPAHPNLGIVGYVRHKREIVNLVQPMTDDRFVADLDQLHDRPAPTSLLCVPVEADSRPDCQAPKDVVAVFQAFKDKEGESFSTRDCKVLYRLGEFVGNKLRNSRSIDRAHALYNASLQSNKRSAALLDVAKALASETRLDSIVSIIVSQVPELLDSDRCTLFFVDREKEQLIVTKGASKGRAKTLMSWIFGQSNAPELPFPPGQNEIRFSMRNGIAGHVAMTGEVVNIVDAHQDPRFNSTMDKETGYRTRSLLCVPMVDSNGVIIGVVQAINKNPLFPRFDAQDETLLKTFSAQAALAVRNSQLLHKTTNALKQADAMLEVTKALSSELKIEALIQIVCEKIQALLSSARCTVFIVDKERKELYTSEHMSFGMGPSLPIDRDKASLIYFPMDRGIAGAVATTGAVVNIPDAYKDPRFNKSMDKETGFRTRSILCMSIKNHAGESVGVIQVMNKANDGVFDEDDEKLLSAFCAQAAVAIENSRLFLQTERALNHALADQRNMKFMLSVTKNLFSDMHLTSMIDQMTMQVHHLLKADDCAVYLVDEAKKEFWLAKDDTNNMLSPTGEGAHVKKFQFNTGIVGLVAATGQTVRISSGAHVDPRFHASVDQRKGKVTHSILCCPIQSEGADGTGSGPIVGVISVRDEKDRGGFEQEEEKLLKVFCAQAAVAINNSRKFSTIMEQQEVRHSDHSAAEYLKLTRGMNLASDDINNFQFKMEDIAIKGAIGTGSYGEVYRAQVNGEIVAVKKLHVRNLKAEQVDAFCKEASLMCQLNHPNVVGFIGAVTEPSNLCIITQYCARGSLADLLLDDKVFMNFRTKVQFALQAAQGMLYLHNSNPVILHRDLKSDNLLVTQDWNIKVADFGLTRFISEKKQMTQVGTPMWMAPEIIMGKKYTEKADVYAFGIILWEILTRLEPYEEKEPMQIVVEVVNDGLRPTIPADCYDSPLVPLMKDCWHTDPAHRPTFEKVVERLKQIALAVNPDDNSLAGIPGSSKPINTAGMILAGQQKGGAGVAVS